MTERPLTAISPENQAFMRDPLEIATPAARPIPDLEMTIAIVVRYLMNFNLIVSQGRLADRSSGAIAGAAWTAKALKDRLGVEPTVVGTPSTPAHDDWRRSLPQARTTLEELARAVSSSILNRQVPVVIASTCCASLASLPVVARTYPQVVVLWFDAHGDFNTPATTESGYLGGMVLAATCGLWNSGHGAGLSFSQIVLIGVRDLDPPEAELLHRGEVRVIRVEEATPDAVLNAVGDAQVWIHVDWDVLEPDTVPADYRVPSGLSPDQIRNIFEALPRDRILGIELAEFKAQGDVGAVTKSVSAILHMIDPLLREDS